MLQHKYPELKIEGENFPPPRWRLQLAQFLGIAKLVMIVMIVAGIDPFTGVLNTGATPSWFRWMMENKLYASMMLFFLR